MNHGFQRWLPTASVLAVGAAISFFASDLARRADDARVQNTLELRTELRAQNIQRRFAREIDSLQSLANYLAVQDRVSATQFEDFAGLAHDGDDLASSVVWAPWIDDSQRATFAMGARDAGVPAFHILARDAQGQLVEEPDRDAYLPVLFQKIFDDRPGPIGFDVISLPGREQWVETARDSGSPFMTDPLVLPMGDESPLGFVALIPVYAASAKSTTVEERRQAFRGVALARFRFDRTLAALVAHESKIDETVDFFVAADAPGANALHLARFDRATSTIAMQPPAAPLEPSATRVTQEFDAFGRKWTLVSYFGPNVVNGLRSANRWSWLSFGLALTLLLALYIERERRRRFETEALVEKRTAELGASNRDLGRELQERRQAEASLRATQSLLSATLEAAPFAMLSLALDRTTMFWNRAAERIFGYTAEEVIGRIPPIAPEEERAAIEATIQRMAEGRIVHDLAARRRRKDGSIVEIRFSGAPVYDDGVLRAFVLVLQDVTQTTALERQLIQAQKMESIGTLTGGMAHDFNNLLGIVIGNLDLARASNALNADTDELVGDALDAALRGAELTQRLLAFARRQPLKPARVDPNTLVGDIVKLLARTLGQDIAISLNLAQGVWPIVIDPAQLEASLANLATNARDAMPAGGRLVIATMNRYLDADYAALFPDVAPGDYAMIEVSDTGAGISPETIGRIFEPFFTTKELGKGTGLGLSMVFGFVKQSGGHINVYSEIGVGTTFRIYLPRAADEAAAEAPLEQGLLAAGRGEVVLAVEDNDALRRVVLRQLHELGYRVREAENAAAALALLETETIDLLFTDIVLAGGVDGYALARQVQARWPSVAVVLTSGFPQTKLNMDNGWKDEFILLSKPYRRRDLARALRAALDR